MPVAPVVNVRAEEARDDAELLHPFELFWAGHLRMYEHRPGVLGGASFESRFPRIEKLLDRRVAVAVHRHLLARAMNRFDLRLQCVGIDVRIPTVLLRPLSRLVVRLAEEAGVTLDGSITDELHRADVYAVTRVLPEIQRPFGHLQPSLVLRPEHQSLRDETDLRGCAHSLDLLEGREPVLNCREPLGGVQLDCRADDSDLLQGRHAEGFELNGS